MAEPTETRILSGKFLMKFSLTCCSIVLTITWFKKEIREVGDLSLLGRTRLFERMVF